MIYTCHIGQIDPERQAYIDRQREVYGDGFKPIHESYCDDAQKARCDMDLARLMLIRDGGGWLDSDVYPKEAWQPPEDGLWLCHSWGNVQLVQKRIFSLSRFNLGNG